MKKKSVFVCDVLIKSRINPKIVAILRLARNIDFSGFEIANIIEQIKKDKEIMKTLPILQNDILDASKWNLFCCVHILKKFKKSGFYERNKKHIWTSVFEI
jgi:hypothetical protein